ncbi:MAG TPA: sulfate ABC transporter permease subunit CysT [Gaiellaceae bacterium]|nr:sulfate ABC transporter permease subunit CysT [Gaiellaceae bacterium]
MASRLALRGVALGYLAALLLVPLGLVVYRALEDGVGTAWAAVTTPEALHAFWLTILIAAIAVPANTVFGVLCALAIVRRRFRGHGIVNSLVDLPFALPTIVAGLTLLALYGPKGPLGVNVAYTTAGLLLALLFVTLPFVVRTVQPVLHELDREMEEAAASLGAGRLQVFRRIVLPNILPAILSGMALAFARAVGEFGAVVLISGNIPYKTEVASVYIFGQIESDGVTEAAAVSVVLLVISFAALLLIGAIRRRVTRHDG